MTRAAIPVIVMNDHLSEPLIDPNHQTKHSVLRMSNYLELFPFISVHEYSIFLNVIFLTTSVKMPYLESLAVSEQVVLMAK